MKPTNFWAVFPKTVGFIGLKLLHEITLMSQSARRQLNIGQGNVLEFITPSFIYQSFIFNGFSKPKGIYAWVRTWSAAWQIASAILGSKPNSLLTMADAFLSVPNAWMTGRGILSALRSPIGKFITDRVVWAP